MEYQITTPLTQQGNQILKVGDTISLSGVIYTARDAAHKRLCALLEQGKPLPFDIKGAVIYYAGPSPAAPGAVIGACGPTTSYRMDAYAPLLLRQGLLGMIGKGARNETVIHTMKETGAVYFAAIGGAGALAARCIKRAEIVCYEDLGSEAVRRLVVENMPLTVVIDSAGNNLYTAGPSAYLQAKRT